MKNENYDERSLPMKEKIALRMERHSTRTDTVWRCGQCGWMGNRDAAVPVVAGFGCPECGIGKLSMILLVEDGTWQEVELFPREGAKL